MPPAPRLREIVHLLDTAPRPLLFHCEGGVERSGLVGAVALLLAGGDLEAARREFAVSKGFLAWLARSDLPLVLDDYEAWLAAEGVAHTPDRFRSWIEREYAPYFYRARIEPVDAPAALVSGSAVVLRFRVTNESTRPIPFRSTLHRGVHLGGHLRALPDRDGAAPIELRHGYVDLDLAPGASTELSLPLPPLETAGRWQLHVDLVDESVKWFADMGSQPLALPLVVQPDGAGPGA
jgi:hypothetical protein